MKNLFAALLLAGCFVVSPHVYAEDAPASQSSAMPEDKAKATYPDSSWDPAVLQFYDMGPAFLSRDLAFDMAPPPANDSAETAKDLETLRRYAATLRTPEAIELIEKENHMDTPLVSYEMAGLYSAEKNPEADKLITAAVQDAGYFIVGFKKKFVRVRPDFLDPDLKTVIPNPGHPAYPSGHAGQSQIVGLILSILDEKHKDIYMAHAYAIGTRREIAGVHYPSDGVASRKLAGEILEKLMENPEFKETLEKVKTSYVPPEESAFEAYKPLDLSAANAQEPAETEPAAAPE
ncbi:MAG: phosphatase PAP2 family protein [Alphaproteobacteria bacterium]|nr:phosphatase PAP2 family protein [Alphaproteobacteria bacterium]